MKVFLKIFAWLTGIIVFLMVLAEIVLSPKVVTKIVDTYAPRFIDGKLEHGEIDIDFFNHFPDVCLEMRDVSLTYPASRFASLDSLYDDVRVMQMGKGSLQEVDTLASFSFFAASMNVAEIIAGKIRVPFVRLEKPRAFLKFYNDSTSNLDIFKFEQSQDTVSKSGMPKISVDRITLGGKPDFVLCMPQDTVFLGLGFNEMGLKGKLRTEDIYGSRAALNIDSLHVFGRTASDTLFFGLDNLAMNVRDMNIDLSMKAKALAASRMLGRLGLPIDIEAEARIPDTDFRTVFLDRFDASVAGIPIHASGNASFHNDTTFVDAEARISKCKLDTLVKHFVSLFWSDVSDMDIRSDVAFDATCKGMFVPAAHIMPVINANISTLHLKGNSTELDLQAHCKDVLGRDGFYDLDMTLGTDFDELSRFLPEELGIFATGKLDADLSGKIRQSQMNLKKIGHADIKANLRGDNLSFSMPADTIDAFADNMDITLEISDNRFEENGNPKDRMLSVAVDVDSLSGNLKNSLFLSGRKVSLRAHDAADILNFDIKHEVYPFGGKVNAESLVLKTAESDMIGIRNTSQKFQILPKKTNRNIPVLKLTSTNGGVVYRSDLNRILAKDINLNATAVMNSLERRFKAVALLDSMSKVYPDMPKDSLLVYLKRARNSSARVPEWMKDKDFQKNDIHVSLDENLKKYFMDWDLNASLAMSHAVMMTPFLPLRTSVSRLGCNITNNEVTVDSIDVRCGESDLSVAAQLSGIRRFILGNGVVNANVDLKSKNINADQILGALAKGSMYSKQEAAELSELSDSEYEKLTVTDTITTAGEFKSPLIVIPGNVDALVNIDAGSIKYDNIGVSSLSSQLTMKERCLQVTNTVAVSDIANLFFEGFYSTRSKTDISAGFSLSLMDVMAEKVVDIIPSLDTIVPILSSFSGMVDLDVAATSQIDTMMNLDIPSLKGVVRIHGKDLGIYDSKEFRKLATLLMFKDKSTGYVDDLSVEGLLLDSKLEVFPFVLTTDRYQLALSGYQNLDTSFKYHVSVIKSPLLIKFGIDLWGDFNKMKYRLGKPKYKNPNNMPAFSAVIDDARVNLSKSIKDIFSKGVDRAIEEGNAEKTVREYKETLGYVAAVDMALDSLSSGDMSQLDSLKSVQGSLEEVENMVISQED